MNPCPWHGLTPQKWLDIMGSTDWLSSACRALVSVAESRDADSCDRLDALQELNDAIIVGCVPAHPNFASLMSRVMRDITEHGDRARVLRWRARRRLKMRLLGAKWTMATAMHFNKAADKYAEAPQLDPNELS